MIFLGPDAVSRTVTIPCKQPQVTVEHIIPADTGRGERYRATCAVPSCGWGYENTAKTDVEQTAVGHRRWHRDALPPTSTSAGDLK